MMYGDTDYNMSSNSGASNNFKAVSSNIVTVLSDLQKKSFPSLQDDMMDLKQAASKITDEPIDKQKTTLQAFFRKANGVINKIKN